MRWEPHAVDVALGWGIFCADTTARSTVKGLCRSTVNGSKEPKPESRGRGRDPKESDKRIWGPPSEVLAPSASPVQCICSRTGKEAEVMEICWGQGPQPQICAGTWLLRTVRPVTYNPRRDYLSHGPVTGQPELTRRWASKQYIPLELCLPATTNLPTRRCLEPYRSKNV